MKIDMSCKAFLVFLSCAGLLAAATQSGSVRSGAQSIPGATVIVDCGPERITTVTDDAGRFEIGGLPATPCRFSVAMFGFETVQKEVTASATPLILDLRLQQRATLPVEPPPLGTSNPAPAQPAAVSAANPPATAASATPAAAAAAPAGQTATPGFATRRGLGRGGYGRGGGQQAAAAGAAGPGMGAAGYQSLSLVQNGDNSVPDADVEPSPGGGGDDAGGANQAFLVNGSVSQGVQAQANDGFGLGAPGGFGPGGDARSDPVFAPLVLPVAAQAVVGPGQ